MLFNATTIPVLEQVASFSQARHHVLAGNLANLDTPGYQARDLPIGAFQGQLKQAIEARDRQPSATSIAATMHQKQSPFQNVQRGLEAIVRHDDVNVGLEQQVAEMNKNQLTHNLAMSVLGNQFRLLGAAISERA